MSPRQDTQSELPEGMTYGDLVHHLIPASPPSSNPAPLPDMRFKFTEDVDTDGDRWRDDPDDGVRKADT